MKRKLAHVIVVGLILLIAQPLLAGGPTNKSNRSAAYMRILARNASTEGADIVTYNPAGTVKLEDGFHINASVQHLDKEYSNNFLGVDHTTDEPSIVPSIFMVYSKDRWAAFFGVDVPLGGGEVEYPTGNFTTFRVGQLLSLQTGLPLEAHETRGESMGMAYTFGGAFQVNDWFAMSLAGRYVDATVEISASADNGPLTSVIDYGADATGFGGILGLDFFLSEKTTIGFKYSTNTDLEYEYSVNQGADILATLGVVDGAETRDDLPAEVAFGISHQVSDKLRIEGGVNYYVHGSADMGGATLREGLDDVIDDSWEIGLGGEFAVADTFDLSVGYLYSTIGVDPEYSSTFLPDLDAHTIGGGFQWSATPMMTVDLALGGTFYDDDSYVDSSLGTPIEVEYEKRVLFLAVGLGFKF
jgi:long-chain fatty acid transport protein